MAGRKARERGMQSSWRSSKGDTEVFGVLLHDAEHLEPMDVITHHPYGRAAPLRVMEVGSCQSNNLQSTRIGQRGRR
jgi:hypothetical protein